jgi:hypothetical protein
MATIFPGSASVGQVFDGYSFDGTAWNIIGIDLTADYLELSTASSTYLTQVSASTTYQKKVDPVLITQSANNASYPLTISSANEQGGGAGFVDIVKLINSKSGATNINKHFRISSDGTLEIVNSGYTAGIFSVSDAGLVTSSNLGDTGWSDVGSFSNSFVSGGNAPGYRRLNNVVYLRGNVNNGSAGQTAFTLPSGYRPATDFVIPVQKFGTSNIDYITVYTDGRVVPNSTAGWLTGIHFPVG